MLQMITGSNFFCNSKAKAVFKITGEDAFSFLQGQFSNDLRTPVGGATYGLWLNQKGKVAADSVLLRIAENEFLAFSNHSLASVIQQRLQDYLVADEVNLSDETISYDRLIISGAGCGALIKDFVKSELRVGQFIQWGDLFVVPGGQLPFENYTIIGPQKSLASWCDQWVARGWVEGSELALDWARIAAGVPAIPDDLGPTDLPQEGGLEVGVIAYNKGCYLGQEVMARLKNLGQVRRRLHVVRGRGAPPERLAVLYQGGKKIGELRSIAQHQEGFVALAMLALINLNARAGLGLTPTGPATIWLGAHE